MKPKFQYLFYIILTLVCCSLAGTLIYHYSQASDSSATDLAKREIAYQDINSLTAAVIDFANKNNKLPKSFAELIPVNLANYPKDPYGREYKIIGNGPEKIFIMYLGKDGRAKGLPERDIDIASRIEKVNGIYKQMH